MKEISFSNIFNKAWDIFKDNGSDLVVFTFVYILLSAIFSFFDTSVSGSGFLISLIISIACGIAQMILSLGFYRVLLNTIDSKISQPSTLFEHTNPILILHYIIGSIIAGVAIVMGFIFLIIPGIYLAIRLQFFTYCLLEQDEPECMQALSDSWNMTKGHLLDLFTLGLLSICIVILGVIAFFVGIFVAIPLTGLISAIAYRILNAKMEEDLPLKL